MRDALGGIVNIGFIVVFIVIVNGYLAFAANYNKAFRYKNKIINLIEQYEGVGVGESNSVLTKTIDGYRKSIGYSLSTQLNADVPAECNGSTGISCSDPYCDNTLGFCVVEQNRSTGELPVKYYTVTTAVNIDIPLLNKFIPNMKIFQVNGTTKAIKSH